VTGRIVLLTGASGLLGSRLAARLAKRGWTVRCLVHRRPVPHAHERVDGALDDLPSLRVAVRGADAVVHLAAVTHARRPEAYFATNVEGTRNLIASATEAGVDRFVHVSTRAISREGGAYSESKADAEAIVEASVVGPVIVRLPELYGIDGSEGVERIVAQARRGAPIPVVWGDARVCPLPGEDVLAALTGAVEHPGLAGRTFTLGGKCVTIREFAAAAAAAFGSTSRIVEIPVPLVSLMAALARWLPLPLYPDQLARHQAPKPAPSPDAPALLGFTPTPIDIGLERLARAGTSPDV
jgi:NADH dehydrogenase